MPFVGALAVCLGMLAANAALARDGAWTGERKFDGASDRVTWIARVENAEDGTVLTLARGPEEKVLVLFLSTRVRLGAPDLVLLVDDHPPIDTRAWPGFLLPPDTSLTVFVVP